MKSNSFLNGIIYLYSFTVVFENYDGLSIYGNSIPKFLGILIILLIVLINGIKLFNKYTKIIIIPLLFFLMVLTLSCLLNYKSTLDWLWRYNTIFTIISIFILLLSYAFDKIEVLNNIMLSFNLGVLVTAILYILNIGVSFDGERLKIFGENANKIGILSVIAVMYIFSIILEKKKHSKIKYLLGLALIPLVNMLASTGSRITFAGLTLGLFIYFFVRNIKFSDIYLRLLTFLPIYFLIQYILSFSVLRNRLFNSIEEGDLSGRDTLWSNLWPYLIENPFMGVGINGYIEISTILYGTYFSPHNVFLEIFAYTGLIGLFLFLLFFYRIFQMTLVIKKRNNLLFPLVLVMLIFMVFFSGQGLTTKPFWLIYLYVVGTYLNSSHEIQENRNFIE